MTGFATIIRGIIANHADEIGDGSVVSFATQLSTARRIAALTETLEDFALTERLLDCPKKHLRRLGSLILTLLPYRWYAVARPIALRKLEDDFKWVQCDCVRFFLENATLADGIPEFLQTKRDRCSDPDVIKAIDRTLSAFQTLGEAYLAPVSQVARALGFSLEIPASWSPVPSFEKDSGSIAVFRSPEPPLTFSRHRCCSTLKLQLITELAPHEIEEMIQLNADLVRDTTQARDLPHEAPSASAMRLLFTDPKRDAPQELVLRDYRAFGSRLLIASVSSPLAHEQAAVPRNRRILDSLRLEV